MPNESSFEVTCDTSIKVFADQSVTHDNKHAMMLYTRWSVNQALDAAVKAIDDLAWAPFIQFCQTGKYPDA